MAAVFAGALGGAEQADGFASFKAIGEGLDLGFLREHFLEVTLAVDVPAQGEAVALAVGGGVQLDAGGEILVPRVPGLVRLGQAARAVAGDEEAVAVVGVGGVVPAFG